MSEKDKPDPTPPFDLRAYIEKRLATLAEMRVGINHRIEELAQLHRGLTGQAEPPAETEG